MKATTYLTTEMKIRLVVIVIEAFTDKDNENNNINHNKQSLNPTSPVPSQG